MPHEISNQGAFKISFYFGTFIKLKHGAIAAYRAIAMQILSFTAIPYIFFNGKNIFENFLPS